MLSRIEPRNRKFSCKTTPKLCRRCRSSISRKIRTVDFHKSAVVAINALQQSCDGRFTRAAAPDDAKHGASGYLEAHAIELRRVKFRAGVGSRSRSESDRARKLWTQPGYAGHCLERYRLSTDPASPIAAPTSS